MNKRSAITSHALDLSRGQAATGLSILLEKQVSDSEWIEIKTSVTNSDGRVEDLLNPGALPELGIYRLTFKTADYFRANGIKTFFPFANVVFEVTDIHVHYHVPLLMSPFGYSTYRGT